MDKRDKIIQAAIQLFVEKGFQATSTTSITNLAGVGTGTLFVYFKNKNELINAVYLESKKKMGQSVMQVFDVDADFEANLEAVWTAVVHWALQNEKEFNFINQFKTSPHIGKLTKEEIDGAFHAVHQMMEQGQQSGRLVSLELNYVMQLIMSHLNATIEYLMENKIKDVTAFVRSAFAVLMNGIRA